MAHFFIDIHTTEYGNIPQNRERIYIVAFRDIEDFDAFSWPEPIPLTRSVRDIIDFEKRMPEKYYSSLQLLSRLLIAPSQCLQSLEQCA